MSNFFVVYQEFLVSLVLVNEYLLLPFSYYLTFFYTLLTPKSFGQGLQCYSGLQEVFFKYNVVPESASS